MESVLILMACLSTGECIPVVGQLTSTSQCEATSQQQAAAWIGKNPAYRIKRMGCVEPRAVQAILGRLQA